MLRTLQNDDEVKRLWTIDGNFDCIVVENNAEVKNRLETPDDLFKLGWSHEKMLAEDSARHANLDEAC